MNYLEFAINMELEGEKYYIEQAMENANNSLQTVFLSLAQDEKMHAQILKNKVDGLPYDLIDSETFINYKNVFKGIDDFDSEIKSMPDQLDAYKMALEKEKESIDLYKKMLLEAKKDEEKKLLKYLIKQEEEHYKIIEDMVILLSRPKEWVEDAEFGLREEY